METGARIRRGRLLRHLAATGLALALGTGCTGGDGEAGAAPGSGGGDAASSGAGGEGTSGAPHRLAAGSLVPVATFESRPPRNDDVLIQPSMTANDEYVVLFTAAGRLRVLDRRTMEELWSHQVKPEGGSGLCELPDLPSDAAHLVVFVGINCTRMMTFDLATGELLEETMADDVAVQGTFVVEDQTYWVSTDAIHLVDESGRSTPVLYHSDLGFDLVDDFIIDAMAIPGSDVIVLRMALGDRPSGDPGILVGVRVDGIESGEVWRHEATDPGLPPGTRTKEFRFRGRGLLAFLTPDQQVLLGVPDPETGEVAGHHVVLPPVRKEGIPALLDGYFTEHFAIDADRIVTGLRLPGESNHERLVSYDLAAGEVAWTTHVPHIRGESRQGFAIYVRAVGFARDGEHGYAVYNAGALQTDLVEFDLETGRQTRRWPDVDDALLSGSVHVDGDLVVLLADRMDPGFDHNGDGSPTETEAVVLTPRY